MTYELQWIQSYFFYLYVKKYKDQFKINQILNDKIGEEKLTKS